jgi:D-beta-D-heptose 7-phosphate kinase/D-beta-D-heptose 1-phosphate adenosyltransferase
MEIPTENQNSPQTKKKIIGLSNGVFDLVHSGHSYLFQEAKKHCDFLLVATNCDEYVTRNKGPERPILKWPERVAKLLSDPNVDAVCVFEDLVEEVILKLKPDVLIIGDDYKDKFVVGRKEIESWGGKVIFIGKLPGVSTTNILNAKKI